MYYGILINSMLVKIPMKSSNCGQCDGLEQYGIHKLDQSVFAHYWRHIGLLSNPVNAPDSVINSTFEDSTDAEFSEEFNRFVQSAGIQSPMMLNDFINPPTEDFFAHMQLTNDYK